MQSVCSAHPRFAAGPAYLSLRQALRACHLPRQREARLGRAYRPPPVPYLQPFRFAFAQHLPLHRGGKGWWEVARPFIPRRAWLPLTRELSPQATEGENSQSVCSAHPRFAAGPAYLSLRQALRACHLPRQREARRGRERGCAGLFPFLRAVF